MRKELIISTIPQETRIAILEDDELVEFLIERHRSQSIAGNIYKGRVTKVLPGMQSAFVDIGLERDAFLYVSDFFEDTDEYERLVATAEDEALKGPKAAATVARQSARVAKPEQLETREQSDTKQQPAKPAEPAKPRGPAKTAQSKARKAPSAEPAKKIAETAPGEPEKRGPRRPPERRERKPRVSSFEARSEQPIHGPMDLLPGESLAKYTDKGKGSLAESRLEEIIDDIEEQHILEKYPLEARMATGDREVSMDVETLEDPGNPAAPQRSPEAGETQIKGSEDRGASAKSKAQEDLAGADPVEPAGEDPQAEKGSPQKRRARISDRPRSGQFSKRAPVRRSRRRTPANSDGPSADTPSKPLMISDLLKEGQEILVQVSKEPLGKKGARITSHIALPGRYLVYMPTVDHVGVSRKISSEDERARLRKIISENRDGLPGGFIVRTAADGQDEDEFIQDLNFLGNLWTEIREQSEKRSGPSLIHSDLNLIQKVLRDQLSEEYTAIRLDTEVEYTKVLEFVSRFQPSLVNRVRLHLKDSLILEEYGLQQEIDKAMRAKVWLKSGGYIVVNQTEALVAIDVNTGKFVGKSNRLEDTIVRTNMDAVHEIVRQIRLRNLGGIIVVDFIDMDERRNRHKVMQSLEEELRKDRSPSKILQFNDFGLVAITRKRTQPSLEKILGTSCPRCDGAGYVKAVETVCYEIQQEVKKMLGDGEADELTVRVSPEVAKALKSGEFVDFAEMEEESRREIRIHGDPTLQSERFDIY